MDSVIKKIAAAEKVDETFINKKLETGRAVIPLNFKRKKIERPVIIGEGFTVKVNANIGGSPDIEDVKTEVEKLFLSVKAGADTVMDLTIGRNWKIILREILKNSAVPVGTVPVYGAVSGRGPVSNIKSSKFIDIIREQARMGVDFITIHSGITKKSVDIYNKSDRVGGIVSRGGKLLYRWITENKQENPLYEQFDEILDIAKEHNVTLSLGDGMRPGAVADASDKPQFAELDILGELARRCRRHGVGVMIEGPGHVPLNKIEENVLREKEVADGAPFYVLGPLTTDIGVGFDHITGAIGGALAAFKGADFLCYVTPAEHMHLPSGSDVIAGVVASKIAAHSADIARGNKAAIERDRKMSEARKNLDWEKMAELAIYPELLKKSLKKYKSSNERACTMCGKYCALLES